MFILTSRNDVFNSQRILKLQEVKKANSANEEEFEFDLRQMKNESVMQEQFALRNLAPKVYSSRLLNFPGSRYVQLIIMDKLNENTLISLLRQPDLTEAEVDQIGVWLIALLKTLSDNKLIHGDLHTGNIGIEFDANAQPLQLVPKFIDFGYSSICNNSRTITKYHILDVLQLMRSICISYFLRELNVIIKNKLLRILYEYFQNLYSELNVLNRFDDCNVIIFLHQTILNDYVAHHFIPFLFPN